MINYKQAIFQSRVNTILGLLFIGSWSLGCGLILWQASFDENPLSNVFASAMSSDMQGYDDWQDDF